MRTGWLGLLVLVTSAWMWGCAAGAPEQEPVEIDPGMLAGTSGGGGGSGSGGKGGSGGTGGGPSAGSGGSVAVPRAGTGGASSDAGTTLDGGGGDAGPSGAGGACEDTKKNGTETGTDCGGTDCEPCPDGKGCVVDDDCESGFCGTGFTCASPGCTDKAKNGDETDVDCGGGDCPGCANDKACADDSDCMSDACESDQCTCVPLEDCGANECGEKPDGCGGMVTCSLTCAATEACQANTCVTVPMCVVATCPACSGLGGSPCCRNDTCGCSFFGLGCN